MIPAWIAIDTQSALIDVDADEAAADKNPEDTLKKVFDMLKDYFEGDEENMEDEMEEDMMEAKDDDDKKMEEVKDEDAKNEEADLEERAAQGFGDPGAKNTSGKDVGFTPAKTTKGSTGYDGSSKALQERFQKLANIIK